MNGLTPIAAVFAASQGQVSGSLGDLGVVEVLLLCIAGGFLLYVFSGQRRPSGVVAGLFCIATAAVACAAFLFLPMENEQVTATLEPPPPSAEKAGTEIFPASPTVKVDEAADAATTTSDDDDDENIVKPSGSRPAWLDQPPSGLADGVYQEVVSSGQYATWRECQRSLDRKMYEAVIDYLSRYQDPSVPELPLARDFIERRILQETFTEQLQSPRAGEMYEMHALLRFDAGVREELQTSLLAYHEQMLERDRLLGVGGLAGLLLAFVASIYGYLRIDTATKGYYSGRLKLALAAITLFIGAGVVSIFDVIDWDKHPPTVLHPHDSGHTRG